MWHLYPGKRDKYDGQILITLPGSREAIALKRWFILLQALCLILLFFPAGAENAADLASLQRHLLSLGYEIGTADGILGTKTSSALLLAQTLLSEAGFKVSPTGQPDAASAANKALEFCLAAQ